MSGFAEDLGKMMAAQSKAAESIHFVPGDEKSEAAFMQVAALWARLESTQSQNSANAARIDEIKSELVKLRERIQALGADNFFMRLLLDRKTKTEIVELRAHYEAFVASLSDIESQHEKALAEAYAVAALVNFTKKDWDEVSKN